MKHEIEIRDWRGNTEKIKVSPEAYKYIQQLEYAIKYPIRSKIWELYPDKFKKPMK